jgi:diacylglycerol kinase family enzyme
MAGCGPAGALVDAMAAGSRLKRRFGRVAYYMHAGRLFLTRRWPAFTVESRNAAGEWRSTVAIAMMACWVPDLGGLFSGVTHRASIMDGSLHIQVVHGPAWLSLPLWMLFGARGPWVREIEADELRCAALDARKVYVQVDAEPMGPLPFELKVVKDAVVMLMPPGKPVTS